MTTTNTKEIISAVIEWEKKLEDFYEMLEDYLKNEESRHMAEILHKQQNDVLDSLRTISFEGKETEFIKNLPEEFSEIAHPHYEISADATPMDVLDQILKYEEVLEKYYVHLKDIVVYDESKDLFDMLATFKLGQLKHIERLMEGYN